MAFVDAYPGGRVPALAPVTWTGDGWPQVPGNGRQARFSYSPDGTNFTGLGPAFTLKNAWQFFMGYRYGVFNHATKALGGRVTVRRFVLAGPGEDTG